MKPLLSAIRSEQIGTSYKLLAVDFDGVVVDSVAAKTRAMARLFANEPHHVDAIVALHERYLGVNRERKFELIYDGILRKPLSVEQKHALSAAYRDLVIDDVIACPMISGVEQLLSRASRKVPIVIVSATPEDELREIVERRGLSGYFAGIYGGPVSKDVRLARLLRQYGVARHEVLFVGDSLADYDAAAALGVHFVAIVSNERKEPFPENVTYCEDMNALIELFDPGAGGR